MATTYEAYFRENPGAPKTYEEEYFRKNPGAPKTDETASMEQRAECREYTQHTSDAGKEQESTGQNRPRPEEEEGEEKEGDDSTTQCARKDPAPSAATAAWSAAREAGIVKKFTTSSLRATASRCSACGALESLTGPSRYLSGPRSMETLSPKN